MNEPLLAVRNLHAGYGRGDIVKGVSLEVSAGEIVTVIGPNGAGKSTLIKAIAGLVRLSRGSIALNSISIAGLKASEVSRHGVAYVPQEANVFRSLTVSENLEMGAWTQRKLKSRRLDSLLTLFPLLYEKRRQLAGNLSGGERQVVALAMALMVDPRLLLLDEPSAGLAPQRITEMFQVIRRINEAGTAILMVEQNAVEALRISHRGCVMGGGLVHIEGAALGLLDRREVSELFLGAIS